MQIPVHTFRLDRFDPLQLSLALYPEGPGFLESPDGSGRYSIVPLRRSESYRLDDSGLVRIGSSDGEQPLPGDPFQVLEEILRRRRIPRRPDGPLFPGGFFGYLAYDLAGWIEELPRHARRDRNLPHLWLDWVDLAAVYDHRSGCLTLASLDPADDLEPLEGPIRKALAAPTTEASFACEMLPSPLISQQRFEAMVARAKQYIASGDIYQANLSCRFDGRITGSTACLYRKLRRVNPSPFACLLRSPGLEIISSSPERLVCLHGEVAEARPIAGTRPRGFTPPEDVELGHELLGHPKERAEHVMLLDLERNDLGKVCRAGSVQVDELMVLERYSHVTHIVSNVRGLLREEVGPFELIRAMFPGGTITGVPKKRCMEIIEELEPVGRGSYTGSAGYISATGDMDLNILIRTFQRFGDELTYQVGAGIVADSEPEREWHECLAKGMALRKTLEEQS
ncbi:anthranilate synthase component I [Desulfuromonas versatilis]|uniref:Anthranilate synthase component I n=1 Tax=Desulfuromonas versatilis TaxID=2802975 RepID=A0ABN6DWR7_9BACT|nr:anthranilate synthase component I family protein [Desulfuromonas versatilis]BCR04304.1 anthranilate synthase component I [Desulfuromonas versatilis]